MNMINANDLLLKTVQAKNFHGSSDICLMDFIYSI